MSSGSARLGSNASLMLAAINDRELRLRQTSLRLRYNCNLGFPNGLLFKDGRPHPDLILSPYDRPSGQSLSLLDLSREILDEIGSYLPAFWLLQFSTACRALNDLFSFKKGNVHWYRALPPATWQQMEKFQDEEELKVHILAKQFPSDMMRVWFPDHYRDDLSVSAHRQPTAVAVPCHSGLFLSAGFTATPQIPYAGTNWALYYPPIGPVQAHAYVGTITGKPIFVASRAHKTLLGSKYDCDFNYRREIMGYLKQPHTCVICLNSRNPNGSAVRTRCWKLVFCLACLEDYRVAETTVLRCAPILRIDLGPYRNTRKRKQFRPQLNKLALQATGYSFDMIYLLWQTRCQKKRHWRLERSPVEARRRAIRFRIITAAEALWEGRDPFPIEVVNLDTGVIQLVPHPGTPDATKYSVFRNRFAPTDKLKDFLFSPAALSSTPSQLAYYTEKTWPRDPTGQLRTNQQFADVNDNWISCKASLMLSNLTNWQHDQYFRQGIDSWKQAAMSWHLARLEKEIETGGVYRGTYVTSPDRGLHIKRLKALLGYVDDMQELPSLLDRGTNMTFEEYQRYLRKEETIRHRQQVERERQKIFNKLVRETCFACPENGMLSLSMGLKGICNHCFDCHPRLFWELDFHCLA